MTQLERAIELYKAMENPRWEGAHIYGSVKVDQLLKSSVTDFDKLLREFPRLKFNFKKLVKTHYGYDILKEHRTEDPQPVRPILFTF